MDPRIDQILDEIARVKEGGFVNDPDDPGGPTKHGISLRYAKGIGLDLDRDQDTDIDDIRLVDVPTAKRLFLEDFYYGPKIHTLPEALHAVMVDFAILSGPPRAIMTLQKVLNMAVKTAPELGYAQLDEDGLIGGLTRRACFKAWEAMGPYLVNALCEERERFLYRLAEYRPASRKYVVAKDGGPGGWIKRARSYRLPVD